MAFQEAGAFFGSEVTAARYSGEVLSLPCFEGKRLRGTGRMPLIQGRCICSGWRDLGM